MKLLVINPNISAPVTELIGQEARRAASPGTEIDLVQVDRGVEYIETAFEALIAAEAVTRTLAETFDDHDAIVVAAHGDPGLPGLKELFDVPVIGLAEATHSIVNVIAPRFSLVAVSRAITRWYAAMAEQSGMGGRLVSIRPIEDEIPDIGRVGSDFRDELATALDRCVADGADAVIVAGAPLAGVARELAPHVPIPLVDSVAAGVHMAEVTARMGLTPARAGACAPPPRKRQEGIAPAVTRLMRRS